MRIGRLIWSNCQKGFTLIELLVAMSLIVIFTSISISRFIEYNRRQSGKASIDLVRQAFLEARSNAVAGKKDCISCGGVDQLCDGVGDLDFIKWVVYVPDDNEDGLVESEDANGLGEVVVIQGICGTTPPVPYMKKTQTLSQPVTWTGPCDNPNKGYGFDGMAVAFPNTCTVTSLDSEYSVSISTTGAVSGVVN